MRHDPRRLAPRLPLSPLPQWADLAGAPFEGALLSSSDVARLCENPTLDQDSRDYELGCKKKLK